MKCAGATRTCVVHAFIVSLKTILQVSNFSLVFVALHVIPLWGVGPPCAKHGNGARISITRLCMVSLSLNCFADRFCDREFLMPQVMGLLLS